VKCGFLEGDGSTLEGHQRIEVSRTVGKMNQKELSLFR
jgi:hypothetical protein